MSQYAVVGNPVKHSKSPLIHSLFARQTGHALTYEAIQVEEDGFDSFVTNFFASQGSGLNITVPYKEKAFALATTCTPRASLAKAVNTLFLDAEKLLCGDNTDGVGLVTDIKNNHGFELQNKKVLILGAGGAVRGTLAALVFEQLASITIANRTVSRAEQLKREFGDLCDMQAIGYEGLGSEKFDLIINGTSLSLSGEIPAIKPAQLAPDCCCYDMMYASTDTVFVNWARLNGAALSLDGLGMLVEQAAEAFAIWRNIRPDTAAVIDQLRVR